MLSLYGFRFLFLFLLRLKVVVRIYCCLHFLLLSLVLSFVLSTYNFRETWHLTQWFTWMSLFWDFLLHSSGFVGQLPGKFSLSILFFVFPIVQFVRHWGQCFKLSVGKGMKYKKKIMRVHVIKWTLIIIYFNDELTLHLKSYWDSFILN